MEQKLRIHDVAEFDPNIKGREHGPSEWLGEILHRLGDHAPQCGLPIAPRLFIHERCARLVECLPSLQHDPNRPEDVLKVDADEDSVGGDDAATACGI